jgi:hypothetical protein
MSEEGGTKKTSVSILGVVISGLIVFTATTFYTDIYKQPKMEINLTPISNNATTGVYQLAVKNSGIVSANHFRLTMESNSDILNHSNVLPVENFTLHNDTKRFLIGETPRLAAGATSVFQAAFKPLAPTMNFRIFSTYDQGSTEKVYVFNTSNAEASFSSIISTGLSSTIVPVTSAVVASILAFYGIYKYYRKRLSQSLKWGIGTIFSPKKNQNAILTDTVDLDHLISQSNFDVQACSDATAQIIRASSPNFSVGIYGERGTGKTTLMKLIERKLSNRTLKWDYEIREVDQNWHGFKGMKWK